MTYEDQLRANLNAYMDATDKRIRRIGRWAFGAAIAGAVLGFALGMQLGSR